MKKYRADLHIHTVLSPCGSLEMSPKQIVNAAQEQKLDIIGITDHNSMRQCNEIVELGIKKGLMVLRGVEIATREEAHCLAFFENNDEQTEFQNYLDTKLPNIPYDPVKFGDQVWVNIDEEIKGEEQRYLLSGLQEGIEEVAKKVKQLNGLFIPAHVDRSMFSIISQLGFINKELPIDAIEISANCDWEKLINKHPYISRYSIISSSDAHLLEMIGTSPSIFEMQSLTFKEIRKTLAQQGTRKVYPERFINTELR